MPEAPSPAPRSPLRRRRRTTGGDQGVPGRSSTRCGDIPAPSGPPDRRLGPVRGPICGRRAEGLPNVHFEGRLDSAELAAFFRGATRRRRCRRWCTRRSATSYWRRSPRAPPSSSATSAPCPNSSPRAAAAWSSTRTRHRSSSRSTASSGIPTCSGDELGANGRAARNGVWSEEEHLKRYFDLIDSCRTRKAPACRPRAAKARRSPLITSSF